MRYISHPVQSSLRATPESAHGELSVLMLMCYAGEEAAGQAAIEPFRALATPMADMIRSMPYVGTFPPEEEAYRPLVVGRTPRPTPIASAAS